MARKRVIKKKEAMKAAIEKSAAYRGENIIKSAAYRGEEDTVCRRKSSRESQRYCERDKGNSKNSSQNSCKRGESSQRDCKKDSSQRSEGSQRSSEEDCCKETI